jgi:ABC-2 type transport system permease protein
MRLFVSGLQKLTTRMATLLTFGLLAGLLVMIDLAVATTGGRGGRDGGNPLALITFPGAYDLILSFLFGLGGLFAVIYGAAIAGSEWTWGTLKSAVARGESRSRYQLVSFAAIAIMVGLGLVVAVGVGVAVAVVGANLAGVSTAGVSDTATLGKMPELLARGWLAIVEEGALGFAIATLARSQLAGIGAGIGVYFGEQFASIFLPDIVKYLPFNAASAVVATTGGGGFGGGGATLPRLEPNVAMLVVAVWLIGALAVTALFTERAEISG